MTLIPVEPETKRVPTRKQYERMRILSPGRLLCGKPDREQQRLIANGWWEPVEGFTRITPAGLRALAAAVEKYGHPKIPKRTT